MADHQSQHTTQVPESSAAARLNRMKTALSTEVVRDQTRGKEVIDVSERSDINLLQRSNVADRVASVNQRLTEKGSVKSINSVSNVISEGVLKKFECLKYIGTGKAQTEEWTDSNIRVLDHLGVNVWFDYDQKQKQSMLEIALSSLTKSVSPQSVGAIMVCAWGAKSCENQDNYMFDKKFPKMDGTEHLVNSLETRVSYTAEDGESVNAPPFGPSSKDGITWELWEMSATYICLMLLRLVVKEESNIKNAWEYMRGQFNNFYSTDIGIEINLNMGCLTSIRQLMQSRTIIKNTLGIFLLSYCDLIGQDQGMCRMLFALQMSYTGMHAYSLMLSCADKLGVPIHTLVALLYHPITKPALETIMNILMRYEFPNTENYKREITKAKTWRFARIFDSTAFAYVQTKNCLMLTSVLAIVSQRLGTRGAGDVTKIRQIAGYAENQREWLDSTARNVIEYCAGGKWSDTGDVGKVFTHRG